MQMICDNPPRVGQRFRVSVFTNHRPVTIDLFIDQQQLRHKECPDPPCHEELYVGAHLKDRELIVIAHDGKDTEELKFRIKDQDTDLVSNNMATA